jgi:hypothetical protein
VLPDAEEVISVSSRPPGGVGDAARAASIYWRCRFAMDGQDSVRTMCDFCNVGEVCAAPPCDGCGT